MVIMGLFFDETRSQGGISGEKKRKEKSFWLRLEVRLIVRLEPRLANDRSEFDSKIKWTLYSSLNLA